MKFKKLSLFFASLFTIGALASCGDKGTSYTEEDCVNKVATLGAICRTSKNVSLYAGENESNRVLNGASVIVATKWTVYEKEVTIAWKTKSSEGWSKKTDTPDTNHITYIPTVPNYGSEDLQQVFTATLTCGAATKKLVYNVTVPASTEAPTDYKAGGIAQLYNDVMVTKAKLGKLVTVYGYVFGNISDGANVFIGSGEYGCQIYNATTYNSLFVTGKCLEVTGTITNYYGLELTNVTACKEYTGTDIAPLSYCEATAAVINSVTANGTKYDAAPMIATNAVLVSYSESASGSATATMKAADETGDKTFLCYIKSGVESTAKAALQAQFAGAKAGDTFTVRGYQSFYASSSAFEIMPMNADDVVKTN